MRILLLRTWLTNIGNGFIDKGARTLVEQAFPDAEIVESSGHSQSTAIQQSDLLLNRVGKQLPDQAVDTSADGSYQDRAVSVADFVDADIAVLPGCVLYDTGLDPYEPLLHSLSERGVPIYFLGAGGGDYGPETQRLVNRILRETDVQGLITRDSDAYECYNENVGYAYDGLDCAFWIDDWHQPVRADREFEMLTFDKIDEPELPFQSNESVVRTDHFPFERPYATLRQNTKLRLLQLEFFQQDRTMVSDLLTDYLFFYSNASVTHSDRIHACIPTLAYGNDAQFWFETPRAALFDKVLDDPAAIYRRPVSIDQDTLEDLKTRQVEALREMIETTTNIG